MVIAVTVIVIVVIVIAVVIVIVVVIVTIVVIVVIVVIVIIIIIIIIIIITTIYFGLVWLFFAGILDLFRWFLFEIWGHFWMMFEDVLDGFHSVLDFFWRLIEGILTCAIVFLDRNFAGRFFLYNIVGTIRYYSTSYVESTHRVGCIVRLLPPHGAYTARLLTRGRA